MYYISIDAQRAGLSGDIKTMEQYCKKHTKKSKLWKISGQPIIKNKAALQKNQKILHLHQIPI
jgi:hypothetical protein